jgi:hypothetical protein
MDRRFPEPAAGAGIRAEGAKDGQQAPRLAEVWESTQAPVSTYWKGGQTVSDPHMTPTEQERAQQSDRPAEVEQQQAATRMAQAQVIVDDSQAHCCYANFARVTATPEEVIIDFGLNPQPFSPGTQHVRIAQRLIMNFYTAKRLLGALQMTIQRHEAAFGAIELDVRRRANLPRTV